MNWRPRHTVLALLMAAFFSTMAARLVISPLVPAAIDDYGITKGTMGLALTGMWAAYAVAQLPAGVLADRFGERAAVLAALSVTGVASLLLSFAPSFIAFAAAAVGLGIGAGLYFPAATSLLTRLYENTGQALGLHISGGDSAGLVVPVAAAAIAVQYGWRPALLLGAAAAFPALAVCSWRLPATPSGSTSLRERADPRTLARLISRPSVAYTMALATALAFTFQAVVSFFPTFLVEYWSVGTVRAGNLFALLFLLWIAFMPVAGRLSDAFGHDGVLGITVLAMAVGMGVAVGAPTLAVALVGIVLLGIGMSWGGVVASRFMVNLPEEDRTAGYGAVRSVYALLGSAGGVVTGWLAETAGWPIAYGLVVLLLVAALAAIVANRALGLGL